MTGPFAAFFRRLQVRRVATDAPLYLLNAEEARALRRVERIAVGASAGLAVLICLATFLPVYFLPRLFPSRRVVFPLVGEQGFSVVELLWAAALAGVEVGVLVLLRIYAAHETA